MAKKPEPKQDIAIVTMDNEREKTIAVLSEHFAQDNLTLDELEKRIENVYRATTLSSLRDLTRDLVVESALQSAPLSPLAAGKGSATVDYMHERERISSIMSATKRTGPWRPARLIEVLAVMSETLLDLTQAVLQPGVTEIRLTGLMASIKVIVPPGVRVVLQASAFMATVSDETVDPPAIGSGAPVVRITGRVMMTELVAVQRRRELGAGDE